MSVSTENIGPSERKHTVNISRIEQKDNWLQVIFNVLENETYENFTKPEFIINESVVFQMSISKTCEPFRNCAFQVKFRRLGEKDKTNYTLHYIHKVGGVTKADKKFSTDDTWHLIETYSNWPGGSTFVISVRLCPEPCSNKTNSKSGRLKNIRKISLAALYQNEHLLTDLTLKASDNSGYVSFHKFAIEAVSPQLYKSLRWSLPSNPTVTLNRSKATLDHLKDYLYLDKLPEAGLEELLLSASSYKMSDLIQRCINELMKTITSENANALFELAEKHDISQFKWKILERVQNGTLQLKIPDNIE